MEDEILQEEIREVERAICDILSQYTYASCMSALIALTIKGIVMRGETKEKLIEIIDESFGHYEKQMQDKMKALNET